MGARRCDFIRSWRRRRC